MDQERTELGKVLRQYLIENKDKGTYLDLINEYCIHHDVDVELAGDIIRDDEELSNAIMLECKALHIVRGSENFRTNNIEEW